MGVSYLFSDLLINLTTFLFLLLSGLIFFSCFKVSKNKAIPKLLVLYFSFGVIIKLGLIQYNPTFFQNSEYFSIGEFDFSLQSWVIVYTYILVMLFGVMAALAAPLISFSSYDKGIFINVSKSSRGRPIVLIIIWFVSSLILSFTMYQIGIGIHGQTKGIDGVPFIAGLLVYIRWIFVPLVGFYIYENWFRFQESKRNLRVFFLLYFLVAVIIGFHIQSKVTLLGFLLPFLLMNLNSNELSIISKRKKYTAHFIKAGLLFVIVSIIYTFMGKYRAGQIDNIEINIFSFIFELNFFEIIVNFVKSLSIRLEGIREVMLIVSSNHSSLYSPILVSLGGFNASEILYGFSIEREGFTFGLTVGFFGVGALSGSYVVAFVYSFITIYLVKFISRLIGRHDSNLMSIYIQFILLTFVWANITLFFALRVTSMVILFYFIFRKRFS